MSRRPDVAKQALPIAIINEGLLGPGLLAHIAASQYADHLPLHRLERILTRHGVELARQTMCDWMGHVAAMLRPVVDRLAALVRDSKALHTDATRMPYLAPAVKGQSLSGPMWTYVGDRDHPFDVFAFCPDPSAAGIDAFLGNYCGYLHADAHHIYDHLFKSGSIVELGCWTHARRKIHDATQVIRPARMSPGRTFADSTPSTPRHANVSRHGNSKVLTPMPCVANCGRPHLCMNCRCSGNGWKSSSPRLKSPSANPA